MFVSTQLSHDGADAFLDLPCQAALPMPISKCLARHGRHVVDLIASMRVIGVPDEVVRHSVRAIVASYEDELVAALLALKGSELRS